MHWPIPGEVLREHVPAGLELDTFDDRAWIGIVPFKMSGVRLRCLPPVPGASAFPELNVRTYVTAGNKPGVWFFSLDAASALAVAVARRWFFLNYYRAAMQCDAGPNGVAYASVRTHKGAPPAEFTAIYRPAGEVYRAKPGDLDHWLTERYCLYTLGRNHTILRGEIDHEPWPLQPAEAEVLTNTMSPLPLPETVPLLHYAHSIDVRIWSLRPIG